MTREWRQSSVTRYLRCPRAWRLEHVDRLRPDHSVRGFAGPRGTAMHSAAELILRAANRGEVPGREAILAAMFASFDDALARGHSEAASYDDERVELALESIEGEDLERMVRFAADDRLRAIDWRGVEVEFRRVESGRSASGETWERHWSGTIDAWGVAQSYVPAFAQEGREERGLYPGDRVLVDWKSGTQTALGRTERAANVQLGLYAMILAEEDPGPWRTFVGQLRDLDPPKTPKDSAGDSIPKRLPKSINPDFAAAKAVVDDGVDPRESRRKPRDPDTGKSIPKWLPEAVNPAWEAALKRPRGPLFRECRLDWAVIQETISAAVRGAEAGLFPASGALTGQCMWCEFSSHCTQSTQAQEAP